MLTKWTAFAENLDLSTERDKHMDFRYLSFSFSLSLFLLAFFLVITLISLI